MNKSENRSRYASFYQRLLAHNIDLIPLLSLLYLTTLIPAVGFDLLITGITYFLYNLVFELSDMKATPGKRLLKLFVTTTSSKNIELRIVLRNLLKPVSLVFFFLGFYMISISKKRQGFHDYIAGTIVLIKEEQFNFTVIHFCCE